MSRSSASLETDREVKILIGEPREENRLTAYFGPAKQSLADFPVSLSNSESPAVVEGGSEGTG